jgi:uncharacterized protein (DUF305 family)
VRRNWITLAVSSLVAVAVLTGCGGGDDESTTGNQADAAFVADMVPHHEGAVVMAEMAQQQAENPKLKALADEIIVAQEKEIAEMEAIKEDLPEPDGGAADEHMMGEDHTGHTGMDAEAMGMNMDPAELADAESFDIAFIDMMIPHHEGAVEMANQLLDDGENPELQAMAEAIVASQTAEIEQMRQWRAQWAGEQKSGAGQG